MKQLSMLNKEQWITENAVVVQDAVVKLLTDFDTGPVIVRWTANGDTQPIDLSTTTLEAAETAADRDSWFNEAPNTNMHVYWLVNRDVAQGVEA